MIELFTPIPNKITKDKILLILMLWLKSNKKNKAPEKAGINEKIKIKGSKKDSNCAPRVQYNKSITTDRIIKVLFFS